MEEKKYFKKTEDGKRKEKFETARELKPRYTEKFIQKVKDSNEKCRLRM